MQAHGNLVPACLQIFLETKHDPLRISREHHKYTYSE
jgi:hypothetical protein